MNVYWEFLQPHQNTNICIEQLHSQHNYAWELFNHISFKFCMVVEEFTLLTAKCDTATNLNKIWFLTLILNSWKYYMSNVMIWLINFMGNLNGRDQIGSLESFFHRIIMQNSQFKVLTFTNLLNWSRSRPFESGLEFNEFITSSVINSILGYGPNTGKWD